jgi:hypothetical protein
VALVTDHSVVEAFTANRTDHAFYLTALDSLLWVWLYRLWPRCLDTMMFVKPATVIKWPRRGFGSIGVGVQGPDAYQWIARFVI